MAGWTDEWQRFLNAAGQGDALTVRCLLSAGCKPSCRDVLSGYTALHLAATAGHLDVVRLLVESGANIADRHNTVESSALAGAVVAGQTDVVAYLLANGADPDERLYGDDRPLLEEAQHTGHVRIVELLTEAKDRTAHRACRFE